MSEPYRIPSCPACSRPIGEQPRPCELCGQSFCASCAETGACAPCLSKACKVVQRIAGERERKRSAVSGRMLTWIPLSLAAGMCLASVTAAYFTMQQGIAMRTRATMAALEARQGHGEEAPPKAKRQRHHRRHREATPPTPPRDETAESAAEAQLPSMYSVLATLRPETHDPEELIARAHKLQAAGMDILVQSAELSQSLFDDGDPTRGLRTMHLLPLKKGDKVVGTKVSGVRPNSLLDRAGVHDGDIITSINGHEMASPEQALAAYQEAQHGRTAVVELFREGQRVILAIRWPEKAGARIEVRGGRLR